MRHFLSQLISPCQNAFVLGRFIQDNILLTHEIMHTTRSSKNENGALALKVDLTKAYDQLEWSFV